MKDGTLCREPTQQRASNGPLKTIGFRQRMTAPNGGSLSVTMATTTRAIFVNQVAVATTRAGISTRVELGVATALHLMVTLEIVGAQILALMDGKTPPILTILGMTSTTQRARAKSLCFVLQEMLVVGGRF